MVAELRYLEDKYITVYTSEGICEVYFGMWAITADNSGANGVLGMVEMESLVANFWFRICKEYRETMHFQLESNPQRRRTIARHELDFALGKESVVSWPGPGSVVPGAGAAGRYRGRLGRFG